MENNMENEKVSVLVRKYSLPCIISLLVGALYNIVDQIFIANADYLGSYGNAANNVVFPLTVIALAIATMIGDGCCAFVSISLGSGKRENAEKSVGNAITLSIISGVLIAAVYLIFSDGIITLFGGTVNEKTFELAKEYFFWISLGIPFYMFGQAMNPVIRSDGSPRMAMVSLLVGAVTNIILDPIFIFSFGWGMMGAAVATVAGQILSAVISVIYLTRTKLVHLTAKSLVIDTKILKKMIPLGMTSFLSQVSIVAAMAAQLNMVRICVESDPIFSLSQYSQIPTAVIGIVMKFFQIVISVSVGLAAGCIPVTGYNVGAKRYDRVKELMKYLFVCEAVTGLVATIVAELFPYKLIGIFGASSESVYYTEFAVKCIRIYLSTMILSCVNKGAFIFLQSLGKAALSTVLSLFREIILGVGLVLIIPKFLGLDGIILSLPLAEIITFVAVAFVLVRTVSKFPSSPAAIVNEKSK